MGIDEAQVDSMAGCLSAAPSRLDDEAAVAASDLLVEAATGGICQQRYMCDDSFPVAGANILGASTSL
jgi:hypothetical protein